jgi:histidinol-phosphate/aromatic aminotransferase/cobyric acid decarboxylase-like protein/GNAT superfamily N-acetyltransferase
MASNISTEQPARFTIRLADDGDRKEIYRLRHEVYARELGQHRVNTDGSLSDELDQFNIYLVAVCQAEIAGFISVTPPGFGQYSVDKYVSRGEMPGLLADDAFELRLLTVAKPYRGRATAYLLMYAAFRWVVVHGGKQVFGIGRREIMPLYTKMGMEPRGRRIQSGAVTFELMSARTEQLQQLTTRHAAQLNRLERMVDWRLEVPFHAPARCFHGGAFFDAIGTGFDRLERRHQIINADVLDAWFPPSPMVLDSLRAELAWLLRTSPPADCGGLVEAIAQARGVPVECVLPGAGSSSLIFLALRQWLTPSSRVLLLDPTYGEYAHVLEQVVRCRVTRFTLSRENGYVIDLERLKQCMTGRSFDLVILVNPNSPTGRHVLRGRLADVLRSVPGQTRVWVDETYVDYVGACESLERFAAKAPNVIVCKSMSKVYGLSGARVAYLCGAARIIEDLRAITPPWAISLPAQLSAVRALQDHPYYQRRWEQTRWLRAQLMQQLARFEGWDLVPGTANFLLCHVAERGPDAPEIIRRCRARGLFLRDAGGMGSGLGNRALRIAVKDEETNSQMVAILREVLAMDDRSSAPTRPSVHAEAELTVK